MASPLRALALESSRIVAPSARAIHALRLVFSGVDPLIVSRGDARGITAANKDASYRAGTPG
jgi:hypothetical protein